MVEGGYQDPKQNRKFPLNVRKNLRDNEPKWIEQKEAVEAVLGYRIQLVCNYEDW